MMHKCEYCGEPFEIQRHDTLIVMVSQRVILPHTGKNMVYSGSMNREYAVCPSCHGLESQWSAEARDQSGDLENDQARNV